MRFSDRNDETVSFILRSLSCLDMTGISDIAVVLLQLLHHDGSGLVEGEEVQLSTGPAADEL